MCLICRKEYNSSTIILRCCKTVRKIPKTLINLEKLTFQNSQIKKIPKTLINLNHVNCDNTQIKKIPNTLIKLKLLYCDNTQIKKIPNTLLNLEKLSCQNSQIRKIPKTLINLNEVYCYLSCIKKIPETLINLNEVYCQETKIKFIPEINKILIIGCDNDVLISPQTFISEINNKRYLTFTRCQARYRLKYIKAAIFNKLKFAYDPKYIIGHNAKKQLERIFQN